MATIKQIKDTEGNIHDILSTIGYGTCDTAAATAAKVATISDTSWTLKVGSIIGIKYTYSNTAGSTTTPVTLNVNNTGAKNIWYNNAKYTSTSTSICGYAKRVIYYMYDGTYWVWLSTGYMDGNTDKKTSSSKKEDTKLFLVGAETQSTSGQTTYSNSKCYIGTDNCLYSGGIKVSVDGHEHPMLSVSYFELVNLRDNGELIPGQQYRITDYVTTTSQENTESAGHQFDIIVTANSNNTLNEIASACLHEGDTYFSENNANLSAWQMWYCLDNDTNKFEWATTNGYSYDSSNNLYRFDEDKWVTAVGRVCDEQTDTFYETEINEKFSHFSYTEDLDGIQRPTLYARNLDGDIDEGLAIGHYHYIGVFNVDGKEYDGWAQVVDSDGEYYVVNENGFNMYILTERIVNNEEIIIGKGVIYRMIDEWGNDCPYDFKNIKFTKPIFSETDTPDSNLYYTFCLYDENSSNIKDVSINDYNVYNNVIKPYYLNNKQSLNRILFIGFACSNNTFGGNCYDNTFGTNCTSNKFGNGCCLNKFGGYFQFNTFGNNCNSNKFGNSCYRNKFGDYCCSNTFGSGCDDNKFGTICKNNTFGINCDSNTFGNNCESNTFGTDCVSNKFGNWCGEFTLNGTDFKGNEFKQGCKHNVFGNYCGENNFNTYCSKNTFGNECCDNTFESNCESNTFGDKCRDNTFESNCDFNTFGINCNSNEFGDYCDSNTFGNYCNSNTFGNTCKSNTFGNWCGASTLDGTTFEGNKFQEWCGYNLFGDYCRANKFNMYCSNNTFGNHCVGNEFNKSCTSNNFKIGCDYNNFGEKCDSNVFGSYCNNNKLGYACAANIFGSNCDENEFGDNCVYNTFVGICRKNIFGDRCYHNTFESECQENTFGEYCKCNKFGAYCKSNKFGSYCTGNIFGNYCEFNIFGSGFIEIDETISVNSYYRNIIFDSGNRYIKLYCVQTTSSSEYYQNVRIGLGVNNSPSYKTILSSDINQKYETLYKPANSKTISIQ